MREEILEKLKELKDAEKLFSDIEEAEDDINEIDFVLQNQQYKKMASLYKKIYEKVKYVPYIEELKSRQGLAGSHPFDNLCLSLKIQVMKMVKKAIQAYECDRIEKQKALKPKTK